MRSLVGREPVFGLDDGEAGVGVPLEQLTADRQAEDPAPHHHKVNLRWWGPKAIHGGDYRGIGRSLRAASLRAAGDHSGKQAVGSGRQLLQRRLIDLSGQLLELDQQ